MFDNISTHSYHTDKSAVQLPFEIVITSTHVYTPFFTLACTVSQFRCNNGNCISSTLWCDYNNDCGDYSDEFGCGTCVYSILYNLLCIV